VAIVPVLRLTLPQQHLFTPMKHTTLQSEKHSGSKQNPTTFEESSKWWFLPRVIVNWNWIPLLPDTTNRSTGLTRSRGIVTTNNHTSRMCVIPGPWLSFTSSVNVACQSVRGEQEEVSDFLETLVGVRSVLIFHFVKHITEGKFKNI